MGTWKKQGVEQIAQAGSEVKADLHESDVVTTEVICFHIQCDGPQVHWFINYSSG